MPKQTLSNADSNGDTTTPSASNTSRAVLFMLGGSVLLTINDALIKSLASGYPVGEVLFIRGAFVMPWIFMLAWHAGGMSSLLVRSFKGQVLRGVCVIASAFLFISGLTFLPLADAIAAAFTGPLFVTAMAPLVLGEKVGWRRWMAVGAGFIGVLFMVRPGSGALQLAILFPLFAAMFGGMRDLITRRISQTESTVAVLFVTTAIVMTSGLFTAPFGWNALRPGDIPYFALSGFLLSGAHYALIESFRLGEAAVVAPFKYSSLIWAILLGYLVFGDLPDGWTIMGASIVVGAGLYILHRETSLKKKKPVSAIGPTARM